MMESLFVQKKVRIRLESGPMGPYLPAIAKNLREESYKDETIRHYLRRADEFGRWMVERHLSFDDVDDTTVVLYVSTFQRLEKPLSRKRGALSSPAIGISKLVELLRRQGVVPPQAKSAPTTEAQRYLQEFDNHLEREVGLSSGSRNTCRRYADLLIQFRFGTSSPDWSALAADDLVNFVLEQSSKLKRSACNPYPPRYRLCIVSIRSMHRTSRAPVPADPPRLVCPKVARICSPFLGCLCMSSLAWHRLAETTELSDRFPHAQIETPSSEVLLVRTE